MALSLEMAPASPHTPQLTQPEWPRFYPLSKYFFSLFSRWRLAFPKEGRGWSQQGGTVYDRTKSFHTIEN
jgi:hypothetical protein